MALDRPGILAHALMMVNAALLPKPTRWPRPVARASQ